MNKKAHEAESRAQAPSLSKASYKGCLRQLQVELATLQRHFIRCKVKRRLSWKGAMASLHGQRYAADPSRSADRIRYDISNLENGQFAK